MKNNWLFQMVYSHFYKNLACGVGRAGGGNASTGVGIDGHETVLGGGGRLLFEDFPQWDLPSGQA
jgi:hypothetical protein